MESLTCNRCHKSLPKKSFLKHPQNMHSKVHKQCSDCRDRHSKTEANKRPSLGDLDLSRPAKKPRGRPPKDPHPIDGPHLPDLECPPTHQTITPQPVNAFDTPDSSPLSSSSPLHRRWNDSQQSPGAFQRRRLVAQKNRANRAARRSEEPHVSPHRGPHSEAQSSFNTSQCLQFIVYTVYSCHSNKIVHI
jgi:hypothetical protein